MWFVQTHKYRPIWTENNDAKISASFVKYDCEAGIDIVELHEKKQPTKQTVNVEKEQTRQKQR